MGSGVEMQGEARGGRYKYQRLRERLRDAIRDGELSGKLPGERELARRYNANAKTINKALADLSIEGLLVRHVGRGTFVASESQAGTPAAQKSRTYGWLIPAGDHQASRRGLLSVAQELVERNGHRLVVLPVVLDEDGLISADVLTPSRVRGWDGVVILSGCPSDDLVADLHRRHIPLVLANNCHLRIKALTVLPDYSQGVFELCQHLIQLGHERLQLVISRQMLPAAAAGETGYRAAMQRYGLRPRDAIRDLTPAAWNGVMAASHPTGFICIGGKVALEVSRLALESGMTVPTMLSVSCIPEPGDTLPAERSITTYDVPLEAVAYWTAELLLSASPGQAPRFVIVPGQLKDRGSAGTPLVGVRPANYGPPIQSII